MITYIALFRGINVSGYNKIKMTELKQLFLNENFQNVQTYIQSGNVIFDTDETEISSIQNRLINAIKLNFDYTINVLILTKTELKNIANSNPYLKNNSQIDVSKLHVTLLDKTPCNEKTAAIKSKFQTNNDAFEIHHKTIYIYCPNGYGKTKLTTALFEKNLKTSATTRNWKTISRLYELIN